MDKEIIPTCDVSLQRMFNDGKYWQKVKEKQLQQQVVSSNPIDRKNYPNEPADTMSQMVRYMRGRHLVALVHQFKRRDGSLGASGKPDPKELEHKGNRYRVDRHCATGRPPKPPAPGIDWSKVVGAGAPAKKPAPGYYEAPGHWRSGYNAGHALGVEKISSLTIKAVEKLYTDGLAVDFSEEIEKLHQMNAYSPEFIDGFEAGIGEGARSTIAERIGNK